MRKERKSKAVLYLLLLVSLALIVLSSYFIFSQRGPLDSVEFEVKFMVVEGHSGFDVNDSALVFGKTSPGGPQLRRRVVISNNYDFPIRADVSLSKNIVRAIEINSSYAIEVGEQLEIPVLLDVPEDFPLGNYTGKIRFEMYKAV